jgi:hypothetical protein
MLHLQIRREVARMNGDLPAGVPGGAWTLRVPEPAARQYPEADLQHAVMLFLAAALPRDAIAHHSPGEGKRTKSAQAALSRSGYCKGWPDIEIVWRGRVYFIELKAARGVLSAAQRETHRRLVYSGAEVVVCRGVEGVERALRDAGMPLRATVMA